MTSAPIILVPGFWLGAWAWDEVAASSRPRATTSRRSRSRAGVGRRRPLVDHIQGPRRRDHSRRSEAAERRPSSWSTAPRGSPGTRRATRCRSGSRRWSTSTPRPGSRRSTRSSPTPRSRSIWAMVEEEENLDRLERGAEGDVPRASRAGPGRDAPGGLHLHERRPPGHPLDDHRDRLLGRGLPEVRKGASRLGVPGRHPRAAQRHLDRPADQPLADVVEAGRAREDHRRRRDRRRDAPGDRAACSTTRWPTTSGRPSG